MVVEFGNKKMKILIFTKIIQMKKNLYLILLYLILWKIYIYYILTNATIIVMIMGYAILEFAFAMIIIGELIAKIKCVQKVYALLTMIIILNKNVYTVQEMGSVWKVVNVYVMKDILEMIVQ